MGMRFMGQRFVPDSYVMSQLVSPAAGDYIGSRQPRPFTWVLVPLGEVRGYPRGLDVMSLLGSTRAMEILTEEGDTEYSHYREQYRNLEKEFSGFGRNMVRFTDLILSRPGPRNGDRFPLCCFAGTDYVATHSPLSTPSAPPAAEATCKVS